LLLLGLVDVRRHVQRIALARWRADLGAEVDAVDFETLVDHDAVERRADGLQRIEQVAQHASVALGLDREVRVGA
jgi:hypothetical protein